MNSNEYTFDEDFVPYTESIKLKEIGFDIPSISGYSYPESDKLLSQGILYQQAFRWFRVKHKLECFPEPTGSGRYTCRYDGVDNMGYRWVGYLKNINGESIFYETYAESQLECLKKLIEIVNERL
jgi:hypothetical protein